MAEPKLISLQRNAIRKDIKEGQQVKGDLIIGDQKKMALSGNKINVFNMQPVTITGGIDLEGTSENPARIQYLDDPINLKDAANKQYVDTQASSAKSTANSALSKANTAISTANTKAEETKNYVDTQLANFESFTPEQKQAISLKDGQTTPLSSTTKYYRPVFVSSSAPTDADGDTGDIWIQY